MKQVTRHHDRIRGFSLIEMAVVLTVIALIASAALTLTSKATDASKQEETQRRIAYIMEAIDNYADHFGRLPCPAVPADSPLRSDGSIEASHLVGWWNPTNGDTAGNECWGTQMIQVATGDLLIGSVPTGVLNIPSEYLVDGWGRKFSYVMDLDMACNNTTYPNITGCAAGGYTNQTPDIRIRGLGSATEFEANAAVVVISHGANGYGSWSGRGGSARSTTINGGAAVSTLEDENAEGANGGNDDDDLFVQGALSGSTTDSGFDDIVEYRTLWQLKTD